MCPSRRRSTISILDCQKESRFVRAPKNKLLVNREKFEGIVKSLLQGKPMKRDKVKVSKKKPEKLIPPEK